MNRLYFTVILSMFSFLPEISNAYFLQNLNNIIVNRNISCRLDDNRNYGHNFQLCAIRVYYGSLGTEITNATVYDGLYFVNTFRNFIEKSCSNWSWSDGLPLDTGMDTCNTNYLTYDLSNVVQLCICATENCNENINSCQNSIESNNTVEQLSNLMPYLESIIQCNSTPNSSNVCQEQPFINYNECENYVQNHSILCAITVNGTETIQTPLIFENYEAYLDKKIYAARTAALITNQTLFNQTDTYVYFNYSNSQIESIEECVCDSSSLCNQNISTCSLQIVVTASIFPSTEDISSTIIYTSETVTNITTIGTSGESTAQSTTNTQSNDITTEVTITIPDITTRSSSTTVTNAGSSTSSSSTASTQSSTTTTIVIITGGEQGLGSSATVGIACGIIFSVVIFATEIVYFKFFYHGSRGSSFERSVAYRA